MAKTQITTAAEAASLVKDGMTVMVGGFMANGTPESSPASIARRLCPIS